MNKDDIALKQRRKKMNSIKADFYDYSGNYKIVNQKQYNV